MRGEPTLRWFCAMEAFAAAYGVWHDYFKNYTWQPLETACAFFRLPHDQAHSAAGAAAATAVLMHMMAQMAQEELPAGYHLPHEVPCACGCGQQQVFCFGDAGDGEAWYCWECSLRVGRSHRCPRCATLVFSADLAERCYA